ncbi:MAG: methionine adenosyltransferase [Alphaproteobacteria bacterium]|nr:methionine adenosyltransferase [Alphaproteobacteria bacterium]
MSFSFKKRRHHIFTSESVADGHPDKICDQISDAVLDTFLAADPQSRSAVEVLVTTNQVVIAGESRGPESVNKQVIEETARRVIKDIGYEQEGFHWQKAKVDVYVHQQSADIAQGVDASGTKDEGAGDQGIMFGYATNEINTSGNIFMPAAIHYSHDVLRRLQVDRKAGKLPLLGPDAKSQVSLEYVEGKPVRAKTVLISSQHVEGVTQQQVRDMIIPYIEASLPKEWLVGTEYMINPTGKFVIGGPDGDTGLTGRKIIVDTYGGAAPHGGGCFSGKDPTKVDRSAAYAARYLAKNVVASGLAEECLIQLSYAIGVAKPVSFYLSTHGTSKISDDRLAEVLNALMDLTPRGIRTHLKLNQPIYQKTASYGHFGRDPETEGGFTWEKTDLVDALRQEFHLKSTTSNHPAKALVV